MKLIDELFKKYKLKKDSLISYGFILDNNVYKYTKTIHNGSFELDLIVKDNILNGKLIDTDFNDEYTQINQDVSGSFIASLKEECDEILLDIRDKCFIKELYIYNQTNRIDKLIKDKYNVEAEFLWNKFPGFGVYRNIRSNKWFGIIMNIPKNKIVGDDEKEIEVLNVNLDLASSIYLKQKGIYPSYHMNKKNWVSIILDDTLNDEDIMNLIQISFDISDIIGNWIIPANPKYYDVMNMFDDSDIAIWKQSNNILVGDVIYLYVAEPVKAIMFKCEVIEVNIPYEYKDNNVSMHKVMKIKLLKKYKGNELTFNKLNEYGIKAIRGPRSVSKELLEKL